jgi:hypothetical protein
MAPLVGIIPNLRAVLAAHVTLQFVDWHRFRPTHDVQSHGLVGVTAEAADLKIEISGVQCVAEAGRGLSRSFESEHALVPGDTRQTVSFLPSLGRPLRRMPNRTAVDALARFRAHQGKNAPAWRRSTSRYGLGLCEWDTQGRGKGRGNVGDSRHIGNNATCASTARRRGVIYSSPCTERPSLRNTSRDYRVLFPRKSRSM